MAMSPAVEALVAKKREESEKNSGTFTPTPTPTFLDMSKVPVLKNTITYEEIVGEPHPDGIERVYPDTSKIKFKHMEDVPIPDPTWVPDHKALPDEIAGIMYGHNTMVVGPPGTGKTKDQREICARVGLPYYRVNGMEGMEPADLFGQVHLRSGATVWVDGPIMRAARHGGLLTIDEPFKMPAGTLMGMQWLTETREAGRAVMLYGHPDPKEVKVNGHEELRIVLCDNARGTGDNMDIYAATNIQDASFVNRMQYKVRKDYMEPEIEARAIMTKYPWIQQPLADRMVKVANLMRKAWKQGSIEVPFSFRELETWAEIISENGGSIIDALHAGFGNMLESGDEREVYEKAILDVGFS